MRRRGNGIGIHRICAIICGMSLLMSCLTGCGSENQDIPVQSSSQVTSADVTPTSAPKVDMESLLQAGTINEDDLTWAGARYVDGEVFTLWRGASGSEDFSKAQNIYMKGADGTFAKVISEAPGEYTGEWYYSTEGYCFAVYENKLARIEADGTENYKVAVGAGIHDICQLTDGRVMMIIKDANDSGRLAELNAESGEYTIVDGLDFGRDTRVYITEGKEGLLLLNSKGFWKVDCDKGELTEEIPMNEYGFTLPYTIKDFRMLGGASVEFLYQEKTDVKHPKEIAKYREIITIQTRFDDEWLKAMLKGFNDSNYQYYAVAEHLMEISEDYSSMLGPTLEQMEMEIASGGGADLIAGDCIADSSGFIDKGYLEDLMPYMERAGMDLLDFFPAAFELGRRGESIYMANLNLSMSGLRIKEEVLGNRQEPSVEYLMDCLLANSEPSVLCDSWSNRMVLRFLLAGSEDLWGCVDWENKTCNFRSDFFAKALEVSWLYGAEDNLLPTLGEVYNHKSFYGYINNEQLELANEVYIGFLFDDGCHPWMSAGNSLAINSNSQNKEGAWAVMEYLLSEEAQTQKWLTDENGERLQEREYPVNIYAFEAIVLLEQEETSLYDYTLGGDNKTVYKVGQTALREMNWDEDAYRALYDLTDADVEEVRELMYEMRYMPGKPTEILEIVYEEAEKYFKEESSLGETCDTVQNRVQAYLDAYEE